MKKAKNQWSAWCFLGPALVGIILFSIFPIIRAFIMNFQPGFFNFNTLDRIK